MARRCVTARPTAWKRAAGGRAEGRKGLLHRGPRSFARPNARAGRPQDGLRRSFRQIARRAGVRWGTKRTWAALQRRQHQGHGCGPLPAGQSGEIRAFRTQPSGRALLRPLASVQDTARPLRWLVFMLANEAHRPL